MEEGLMRSSAQRRPPPQPLPMRFADSTDRSSTAGSEAVTPLAPKPSSAGGAVVRIKESPKEAHSHHHSALCNLSFLKKHFHSNPQHGGDSTSNQRPRHHHQKLLVKWDSGGVDANNASSVSKPREQQKRSFTANFHPRFFSASVDVESITESFQGKFGGGGQGSSEQGSDDGSGAVPVPLITKLDKYTPAELKEYRQVFNMFDADRSGAIGLDELENAISNLGMDPKQVDVEMLMQEADKRGNHQIDFDEFCEVMKASQEKAQSWNEVIRECFQVFDRSESGFISRKDFEFVLREVGDIQSSSLIEELFTEYDVDSDGLIDFDEFSFLVKNYLTDEDVV